MAKKKNIQAFIPEYKLSYNHAYFTMRAAWQTLDLVKQTQDKYLFFYQLFDEKTGELRVPERNSSTHYWLKFLSVASDCKLITVETFIITIPSHFREWILKHGDNINKQKYSKAELTTHLKTLFGKWAVIE